MDKAQAQEMVDKLISAARLPDEDGAWDGGQLRYEITNILASTNLIALLFDSTKALQDRFGDDWTLKQAVNKVNEELDEFKAELHQLDAHGLDVKIVQAAFCELIDVWVTMFSCLIRLGIQADSARFYINHSIHYVIEKNGDKTPENSERVRGNIVKRQSTG